MAGQRISTTQPIGTVVVRGYDDDRRLTSIDITPAGGAVGTTDIDYAHDGLGRITSADLTDGSFTSVVERSYNTLGKIESETQIVDGWNSGNGRTITYDWNEAGQKVGVTYPVSGDVITYDRDELDRVDKVSRGSDEVVDYTFSGKRLIGKARPGSHEERTYDTFGRLTRIHHEDSSSGNTLLQLNTGYDEAHAITSQDKLFYDDVENTRIVDETEDQGDQYAYDGAGRLVTVLRGVPTAKIDTSMATNITNTDYDDLVVYEYDQTGNRLTMDVDGTATAYAYNEVNEMTTEAGVSKSYDANGNFEGVSNAYTYDWRDSLAKFTSGATTWTWRFDAFGRRIQRDKSGVSNHQRSYWDGQQKIETVAYNSGFDSETHKKTFVYGERIDELLLYVDVSANPDEEYYAHADHLGSIQLMVDDTGAIQESYRYTEWGELRIVDDSFTMLAVGERSPIGNPWMYTGRAQGNVVEGAGETWYDYRARHYRADVGRFVQRDPMFHANAYIYADNDPVRMKDPSGLDSALGPVFVHKKAKVKCGPGCSQGLCDLASSIWQDFVNAGDLPDPTTTDYCIELVCAYECVDSSGEWKAGVHSESDSKNGKKCSTICMSKASDGGGSDCGLDAAGPKDPCAPSCEGFPIGNILAHELGHEVCGHDFEDKETEPYTMYFPWGVQKVPSQPLETGKLLAERCAEKLKKKHSPCVGL